MRSLLPLALVALSTGMLIPVLATANTQLSQVTGSVIYSALTLFAIAFLCVAGIILMRRAPVPELSTFVAAPWYSYLGGFIVATYILSITYLLPRLGVGNAICFVVSGQIIAAVIIDHFGLMNLSATPLNLQRFVGVGLMISGLFLARS